jgi:hypothetical protein
MQVVPGARRPLVLISPGISLLILSRIHQTGQIDRTKHTRVLMILHHPHSTLLPRKSKSN